MKKAIALFLCALMLLTLFAGCAKKETAETTDTAAPSSAAPTTEPPATEPPATEPPATEPPATEPPATEPPATEPPATEPPATENPPEPGADTNRLIFYWTAPGVDYSTCDMWIWYPNKDGRGYLFEPCDYGGKVELEVPLDVTEVGFIVRRDCSDPGASSWGDATKDFGDDRFAVITGPLTEIYLKPGDGGQYFSTDGGQTLTQNKLFSLAAVVGLKEIQYYVTPEARFDSLDQIRVFDGDRQIAVEALSTLNEDAETGVITLAEELDFSKIYTVELEGFEGALNAVPTAVFDSEEFVERYTYDGDDLGAVIDGANTVFKLWAPTASKVVLNLFEAGDGGEALQQLEMELGEKGVWSLTVPDCGHGVYYTYTVTTAVGEQEAVDPYAKAVGVNGNRGMVVDLAQTDPEGFAEDKFYDGIDAYNEAVIWEVHVRDFSNTIADSAYPGKYLAFTETGLTNAAGQPVGIDYLKDLGVTHVHLQPVYDYATVDETKLDKAQFNWGYDPKNYNAPEGSYSTDPYHGEVRITEFKQMVQGLHDNGMAIVMDVVYNHTFDINSCLNKVVPYYYYRYNDSGAPSNGSGCGNETASDRVMFRKYMVDSVAYWAKEYHIDGFRFDLMALHDVQTMQEIEAAVHAINPKAIIYGEGWTGGTSALSSGLQANQANIHTVVPTGEGIGPVAVFNDAIRDGLKGSVFDASDKGYINGKATAGTAKQVIFGILGGVKSEGVNWSVEDNAVINYMACHDNHTIWDKLLASNKDASDEERFAMNRLGIEIIMLGKGVPFFLAGEEMLRTKQGDHNSYASSDAINNLDWESLTEGSLQMQMHDLYRSLIAMRKANDFFMKAEVGCELLDENVIQVIWKDGETVLAVALINPNEEAFSGELPEGSWKVLLSGETVDLEKTAEASGAVEIPAKSVLIVTGE